MFKFASKVDRKYFHIEVLFFVFICYLSSIISDMEYSFYEKKHISYFTKALEARLVWGTFAFVFYGSYYWFFLKDYVFRKRAVPILCSIILFILCSHVYNKYVVNYLITEMDFLSHDLRKDALNELNRPTLYFIVSYTLNRILFTIIGFAFLIRSLQQDEQLKVLKEQQLVAELIYLKAQLQPHFFFNTLNNIYSLALKQDKDTAPVVAKLAEMMRYILYRSDEQSVSLKEELAFIANYVTVEQLRYRSAIDISLDIQVVNEGRPISPLILLPFVENAFKHGLQEECGNGFVHIVICEIEDELNLEVKNSIAQQQVDSGGIGLVNVKKRLAMLYPQQHMLEMVNNGTVYHVSLTLKIA